MRIVVTGATGYVGQPLVAALLARGDQLVVLSRDGERARGVLGAASGLETVTAHLEEPGAWTAALAGADAIVHLAGESIGAKRWDAREKQVLRDSRVESTRVIVEALAALPAAQRPRVLVTASGIDYYGFAPERGDDFDDDEVTEKDPPGDSFLARLCRDWETEALAAKALGVRVACMRSGLVFDAQGSVLDKMATPFRWFAGGRIGSGRQFVSWIHRADAVTAYATAVADERYAGPINMLTASTRNAELARAIGAALGKPSWLPVPGFAVRAAIGELADYTLHGRNAVPAKLRALGFAWSRPTLAAALADLR